MVFTAEEGTQTVCPRPDHLSSEELSYIHVSLPDDLIAAMPSSVRPSV